MKLDDIYMELIDEEHVGGMATPVIPEPVVQSEPPPENMEEEEEDEMPFIVGDWRRNGLPSPPQHQQQQAG